MRTFLGPRSTIVAQRLVPLWKSYSAAVTPGVRWMYRIKL